MVTYTDQYPVTKHDTENPSKILINIPAQITIPPASSILLLSSLLFGLWSSETGIAIKSTLVNSSPF